MVCGAWLSGEGVESRIVEVYRREEAESSADCGMKLYLELRAGGI